MRVGKNTEVGDDIFDLRPFLKAHTTDELEVKTLFGKALFE